MRLTWLAALAAAIMALPAHADAGDAWSDIQARAKGQTVYFNAWGGGEAINAYIDWAAKEAEARYGFTVNHVRITDAAEVVKRIEAERDAGRVEEGGTVDLIWVNGENFKALKDKGLLHGPFAGNLPNARFVDPQKPTKVDFSVPVNGMESPWGTAQLTFLADRVTLPEPPRSLEALMTLAGENPGRITYPRPPDFHGTTFLKQLLIATTKDPEALSRPAADADVAVVTAGLWATLDRLHPLLWRKGEAFPSGIAEMHRMLADRELILSLTFNPNEGANLVAAGQLPETAYAFGFDAGMIGNVHFVAIPRNSDAKEAAMVFADFLLSPEAQIRKADITVWGDGTVLAADTLPAESRAALTAPRAGAMIGTVPTLPEPHASWVAVIEQEWLKRYGSR